MILVDEGYLNNHTIARIGEEVGIFRNKNESLEEYAMRIIRELTFTTRMAYPKNEMKISFQNLE